jgi:hypothetical protein
MCLFENYIWLAPTGGDNAIITSHPKITALIASPTLTVEDDLYINEGDARHTS